MARFDVDPRTNELVGEVISAAIEAHTELGGPGLLEEIYEDALCVEFELRSIPFERQKRLPVVYKGRRLMRHYVLDLLVGGVLVVELKATEHDNEIYRSQCNTHLVLTNLHLGLVINFGQAKVKDGLHRVINRAYRPPSH